MVATKDTLTVSSMQVPIAKTATFSSTGVDLANFGGNTVVVQTGVVTDGTFAIALEESDALGSGYSAVAAADQVGTFANATSSVNGSTSQKVSYIGAKRYIRVTVTVTGSPSTGALIAIYAILARGHKQP